MEDPMASRDHAHTHTAVTSGQTLKPCPFCGGAAELADIGNWHTKSRATEIKCTGCLVKKRFAAIRQGHEKTREWATTWWNQRADTAPAPWEPR